MNNCSIRTAKGLAVALSLVSIGDPLAAAPSFDCSKVEAGSIEALICQDDQLSALDGEMAKVFAAATKKASNEHPPVLKAEQVAEFGDQTSLMYQQPAASGTQYQGRNETLWEHQDEAVITWGYGSPEMHCRAKR